MMREWEVSASINKNTEISHYYLFFHCDSSACGSSVFLSHQPAVGGCLQLAGNQHRYDGG